MANNDLSKDEQAQLDRAIRTSLGGPLPAGVFSAKPEPAVRKATKVEQQTGQAQPDEDKG